MRDSSPYAAAIAVVLFAADALAHPISISQENVFVARDKVVVTMRVFAEDLYFFHDLRPDDLNVIAHEDLKAAVPKHAAFLRDRIRVIDANGERLEGTTTSIDEEELVEPGFQVPELAQVKLQFTMEFPLPSPPEFLTFSQHVVGPDSGFVSEIQLNVKQEGNPVEVTHALTAANPYTMRFDWESEPLDAEASRLEREEWLREQLEKTLGIVDPNAAYSRFYVSDRGVRHELLLPFTALESFLLVDREKRAFLEVAEQEAARRQIAEELRGRNQVEIDGVVVAPIVEAVEFHDVSVRDVGTTREDSRVSTANSRVGIVFDYPAKSPPRQVAIHWDLFSRLLREVDVRFIAPDGVHAPIFSTYERSVDFEWVSPGWPAIPPVESVRAPEPRKLAIPVLTVVLLGLVFLVVVLGLVLGFSRTVAVAAVAGSVVAIATSSLWRVEVVNPLIPAPTISDDQARTVFNTLLSNTYRAFDYRTEGDVYDALSRSIDGPLLKETYLRVNEGLRMQDQGGAISLVDEVRVLEGEKVPLTSDVPTGEAAFGYRCKWTVEGTVEHWGHLHSRTNQYVGLFTVSDRDDTWKITNLEILDEERVGTRTGLRKP